MANVLTIVARIEAKSDKVEQVKTALLKLIKPTQKEQGCLQYDLHQDNENPEVFLFYEMWESRSLWQTHMSNKHLKRYMEDTAGLVESFILNKMNKIT